MGSGHQKHSPDLSRLARSLRKGSQGSRSSLSTVKIHMSIRHSKPGHKGQGVFENETCGGLNVIGS